MYDESIQRAIAYIEANLHATITEEELLRQSKFSKFHFHRIFLAHVDMTITEYIKMRRLASAASLLMHTEVRILDIALQHNFESQESFTRAFKKIYGLPPGRYRTNMRTLRRQGDEEMIEAVKGWFLSGGDLQHYEMGIDRQVVHEGRASGYLKSTLSVKNESFGTMMQQFKADRYIKQRIRLSGFLKTEQVSGSAGFWMRVDHKNGDVIQFDNMSNRPIQGTTEWNRYSIVLDVPEGSEVISFGVLLSGEGQVWIDQLSFIEVDERVAVTNLQGAAILQDEPINLSFEDGLNYSNDSR
ncbi:MULTISPECIES: helix-turn-helix domain-containing protein [Exiguobacterium]|uniref:helix-turn-helix domain-containing protein n=1 Tax=Exiguobacterium TaxID=33986 RepID=UPI001BECD7E6|nr:MULTISPECIES: AraC family transcriptional regulator [Exiguobacterium]MCT4784152.1 AraC family transcriptional regulator [Exiguobacterium himgiriensis]